MVYFLCAMSIFIIIIIHWVLIKSLRLLLKRCSESFMSQLTTLKDIILKLSI